MDNEIRRLERLAAQGDLEAIQKLEKTKKRLSFPVWETPPYDQMFDTAKHRLDSQLYVEIVSWDARNTIWYYGGPEESEEYFIEENRRDLDSLARSIQNMTAVVSDILLLKRVSKPQALFLFGSTTNSLYTKKKIPVVIGHRLTTKYDKPMFIADDIHPYPKLWSTNIWELDE